MPRRLERPRRRIAAGEDNRRLDVDPAAVARATAGITVATTGIVAAGLATRHAARRAVAVTAAVALATLGADRRDAGKRQVRTLRFVLPLDEVAVLAMGIAVHVLAVDRDVGVRAAEHPDIRVRAAHVTLA